MKKILFIVPSLSGGGAERVVTNLSREISEENEVYIAVFSSERKDYEYRGRLLDLETKEENRIVRNIKSLARLKKIKKSIKPDVSISFLPEPNLMNVLTKQKNEKTIISVRNMLSRILKPKSLPFFVMKSIFRTFYNKADKIVSLSCGVKRDLVENFSVPEEEIKEDREDVVFELAGGFEEEHMDGVDREWVEEKYNDDIIDFLGYVDDMIGKLSEVDIVVLPSYYREGVPRVLLEAMASGKPIVTTDWPGCRETVVGGRNGILVEPEDSEDLTSAILDLIEDKEKRTEMGKEGRKIVDETFNRENVIERYLQTYRSLDIEV